MTKKNSGQYKIEAGVPMPDVSAHPNRVYPFNEMGLGDSMPIKGREKMRHARNAAYLYGRRAKKKFSCRRDPKVPGAWRIFRVA